MRKLLIMLAATAVAAVGFAPAAQANTPQALCGQMLANTNVGNSAETNQAPPISQATYIATSQGWQNSSFTFAGYTAETPYSNPQWCKLRYEYSDAFGVFRLIKKTVDAHHDGSYNLTYWHDYGRDCYYRFGFADNWVPWNCA